MDSIDGFSVPISLATILFCLSGFTLLALVIAVLRGYEIYHRHFRLLLIDLLLPFMIVDTLHALRSVMGLLVHLRVILDPELMLEHFVSGKPDVLPAPLCVVVSTSVLLICMERLYATFNYQKYETEDFAPVLSALCKFKWAAVISFEAVRICSKLDGLSDYSRMLSSDSREQDEKQKDGGIQALLKEDGHLVLTTIFELVLLVILLIGLQVNREHEGVYIRHYYSSLSQRFQIGENVKGIQLMATFTAMLAVSLVAVLAARYIPHLRLWDGLDSLALPTFTIAFPLCMLRRSQVMRSRARILARESLRLVKRPLAQTPGASLMKVGNETIHSGRVLQEYWDDHLE